MGEALSGASVAERSLRLSVRRAGDHDGGAPQYADLGRQADAGLVGAGLAAGTARAVKWTGRATTGDRPPLVLAGVDGLAGRVRLTGGRLPRGCDASRCEVVAVAGARVPARVAAQGVARAGRGQRASSTACRSARCRRATGTLESGSTFLVADGVAPLLAVRELTRCRAHSSGHACSTRRRCTRGTPAACSRPCRARRPPSRASSTAPRSRSTGRAAAAEAARGRAAAAFALIVAALAATVLLAFAAFAAAEQRDDVAEELRRLRAMAARRRDLAALVLGRGGRAGVRRRRVGVALAIGASGAGPRSAYALGARRPRRARASLRRPLHLRRARHRPRPVGRGDARSSPACSPARSRGACGSRWRPGAWSRSAGLVWQAASRGQVDARDARGRRHRRSGAGARARRRRAGLRAARAARRPAAVARASRARPSGCRSGRTSRLSRSRASRGGPRRRSRWWRSRRRRGRSRSGTRARCRQGTLDQAGLQDCGRRPRARPRPGVKPGADERRSSGSRPRVSGGRSSWSCSASARRCCRGSRAGARTSATCRSPSSPAAGRRPEAACACEGVEIPRDARELELPVRV